MRSAPLAQRPVVADGRTAPGVRRLLVTAAVLVFLAGVQLFCFPLRTEEYFAWTIDVPMTAVFLGASYWAAMGLELTAALSPRWAGARIAVPAVLVFTTLTLLVTIGHIDRFHLDGDVPFRTRAVTWAWIAVYAVVPVLMVLATVAQRRLATAVGPPSGLPSPVRRTLVALAVLLGVVGLLLLLAPGWAGDGWPWPLTDLTARAVGAWLVGLGIAAGHARLLDDVGSIQPLAVTGVAFGAFQLLALVRHGDALDWGGAAAYAYVLTLAVVTAVSAWALAQRSTLRQGAGEPSR